MRKGLLVSFITWFLVGCSHQPMGEPVDRINEVPLIFPDYVEITIPENIAPLHFKIENCEWEKTCLFLTYNDDKIVVEGRKGAFHIPASKWKTLLKKAKGHAIEVSVFAKDKNKWHSYNTFNWYVAEDPIDPYIAYRLIEPGYTLWNEMGIYQRNLENNKQYAVVENEMTGNNCMNCHSFCDRDPGKMLLHMRKTYPGTYLITGESIEKLNTQTDRTISALVYPSWHPSGKYVAFSVNDTKQAFHMNDPNRIEVFDMASDVVVYDVERHELVTTPALFSTKQYETYPTFSADGKTLYFCTAEEQRMPEDFEKVKYSLCAISFDPEMRVFGQTVDTLYNAKENDRSVALPRVSPDGLFLLYTLSSYGNFFIWHHDADLHLLHLATKTHQPLTEANSVFAESYHSWSGNSRWIVFSSRRMDGLYTRPYFAYIDHNGKACKPFVLPQSDPDFYKRFMKSYNIPEFISEKITIPGRRIIDVAKQEKGTNIHFSDEKKYPVTPTVESIAH